MKSGFKVSLEETGLQRHWAGESELTTLFIVSTGKESEVGHWYHWLIKKNEKTHDSTNVSK